MYLLFCRLLVTLDPLILLYLLVYVRVRNKRSNKVMWSKNAHDRRQPQCYKNTRNYVKILYPITSESDPLPPRQTRWTFVSRSFPLAHHSIHPDNIPETPSSGSAKYAC